MVRQHAQRLLRLHTSQHSAQTPHDLHLFAAEQVLLTAGAGGGHIDCGEDTLIRQLARQAQLHIA
ncbi:MAG: TilS substrate-binding domain-containing protein, partial [Rothia dentocariosa]|nr:TilS substrate-binding domain-containing protein [Rothia dentocariosa]